MAFVNPYIRNALRCNPIIIERLVGRLPVSAYDERPDPDRFTIREVVCHLADWEPFFLERLKGAVSTDNFQITAYDEGQLALDNDYAHQDVQDALRRYKTGRDAYVALVATLTDDSLDRPAFHPEQGRLTAGDLINIVVGHDVYHIEQITSRM
ncbi:MAG: DinB family protein [Fimbriimonadaceae bacterium]